MVVETCEPSSLRPVFEIHHSISLHFNITPSSTHDSESIKHKYDTGSVKYWDDCFHWIEFEVREIRWQFQNLPPQSKHNHEVSSILNEMGLYLRWLHFCGIAHIKPVERASNSVMVTLNMSHCFCNDNWNGILMSAPWLKKTLLHGLIEAIITQLTLQMPS